MSDRIEHLTTIILRCMTNAPNPEAGARLAAYRVTDELRKALLTDDALSAMWDAYWAAHREDADYAYPERTRREMMIAAWDAVMEDDDE